ncbi:MAG: peptide deformylase [bacterium]|nr:MAG: peptide deformylase [bacterium]
MAVRKILLLGNPALFEICDDVRREELDLMREAVGDLHDTMMNFRSRYGFGRAIAAPQIGVKKRLVYMHIDRPTPFVNPRLVDKSDEMITIWDNCMSFPDLLVRIRRHKSCAIEYRDLEWNEKRMPLEGELSELLQHECDHLDGILAVMRAIDGKSFALKSQEKLLR